MKKLICFLLAFISLDAFNQVLQTPIGFPQVGNPVTLGMKFTAKQSGTITGIRYYRDFPGMVSGQLWDSTGTLLASVQFGDNSAGWKTQTFPAPVIADSGAEYIVSFFSSGGGYFIEQNYFPQSFQYFDAVNSVFAYSSSFSFPENTYRNSNYFVEPIFAGAIQPPPPGTIIIHDTITVVVTKDSCYFDFGKDPLQLTLMLPEEGGAFMLPDSVTAHRALFGAAPPHQRLKNDTFYIAYRKIEGTGSNRRRITGYTTGAFVVEMVVNGTWVAVNQRLRNGIWVNY